MYKLILHQALAIVTLKIFLLQKIYKKEITRSGGKATPKRLPGEQHPSKRKKGKLNLLSADVVSTETGGNLEKRELLNHLLSMLSKFV